MKPITNDEAKLIEQKVLHLKELAKNNDAILEEFKINPEIIEWIQSDQIEFSSLSPFLQVYALSTLFDAEKNNRSSKKHNDLQLITFFLEATNDRRYSEVVRKLRRFDGSHTVEYLRDDIEVARIIMCHGTDVKKRYQEYEKTLTIEKEIKKIKQKHKITQKEEAKRINQYKNIWNIYLLSNRFFERICDFIGSRNPNLKAKIEKGSMYYHKDEIEQFVDDNLKDVLSFLYIQFPFAHDLNYSKIR